MHYIKKMGCLLLCSSVLAMQQDEAALGGISTGEHHVPVVNPEIKKAIRDLIQENELPWDEHGVDYYTGIIKKLLKKQLTQGLTQPDVYQAFEEVSADISESNPVLSKKIKAWLSKNELDDPFKENQYGRTPTQEEKQAQKVYKEITTIKNERLRKVIDEMYQDHVVTAEYFNDKTQEEAWNALMGKIYDHTFQNFITEVHYLNLDTKKAVYVDNTQDVFQGKNYLFKQIPGVDNNRVIALIIDRPNKAGKVPVGIFNHGGGANKLFHPGQSNPILTALGGLDYAIVAPNYRNGSLKEHLEDMEATTAYLQNLEFVDTNKIVLTGISTGTLLNSLVIDKAGSKLAGVFLHTGFYGSPSPSPFDHLMEIPPGLPIFLASGAKDDAIGTEPKWVIKYVRALQDVSHNVSFFLLEQGGHQLISLIHPEIPPYVLSGNVDADFANLKQIIEKAEKRYNTDEMMDYISHLVEFLDKIAYGEIPLPVHQEPESAYHKKGTATDKGRQQWERLPSMEPKPELTNEGINRQEEQVAKNIIGKAQVAQNIKGKTPEAPMRALLLPKNEILLDAPYTPSLAQLKILLGDEYEETDLENTVTRFLEKYDREKTIIRDEFAKEYPIDTEKKIQWWKDYIQEKTSENRELKSLIMRILKKEMDYKGTYVLYHATESKVGFIYDIYSALRRLLTLQAISAQQEEYVVRLRLLDDAFNEFLSASDLIEKMRPLDKKYPTKLFNSLPGYQGVGLSAQWFLFGSYKYWFNSTFFRYFCQSASASEVNLADTLKSFFTAIGLTDEQELVKLLNRCIRFYNTSIDEKDGRLLQIFISPDVIDEVTYVAETGGPPLDLKMSEGAQPTHLPSKVIPNAVQDPTAFEGLLEQGRENFRFQMVADREEFSKQKPGLKYVNSLESRFFMKPEHMDNLTKVQIISHHLKEPAPEDAKTIENIAAEILATSLAVRPKLGVAMTRHKPPLLKLQDYVLQGMAKQGRNSPKRIPFTLYDLLSAGKWDDAEQWASNHKEDVNVKIDDEGHPLLYQLLREHKFKAAGWLVKKGAPLNGLDSAGNPMVLDLIGQDEWEAVDWLLRVGLTLDSKILNNKGVLLSAIEGKKPQRALWLIEHGFDIRVVGGYGFTPLISASFHGLTDVIQAIINKGKKELSPEDFMRYLNQTLNNGMNALTIALLNDNEDIALALIKAGADIAQVYIPTSTQNLSVLEYAIAKKFDKVIQAIVEKLPNYRQNNAWASLRMAVILYGQPAYQQNAVEFIENCLQLVELQGQNPSTLVIQVLLQFPETKDYAIHLFEEKILQDSGIKATDKWAMIQGLLGTDREKAIHYLKMAWELEHENKNRIQLLFEVMDYPDLQEFLLPKIMENFDDILTATQTMTEVDIGMNLGRLVRFLSSVENSDLVKMQDSINRLIKVIFNLPKDAWHHIQAPEFLTLIQKAGLKEKEILLAYSEAPNVIPQFFINLCQIMTEKEHFLLSVYKGEKTNPLLKTKILTEFLRDINENENMQKILSKAELIEDLNEHLGHLTNKDQIHLLFETMTYPDLQNFLLPKIMENFNAILAATQTMPEHEIGRNLGRLVGFLSSLENERLEKAKEIAKHLINVIFQLPEHAPLAIPGPALLALIEKLGLNEQETLLAYSEAPTVSSQFFINLCQGMPEKERFLLSVYNGTKTNPLLKTKILTEFLRDISWNENIQKIFSKDELIKDLYKQFKQSTNVDQKIQLFQVIAYDPAIDKQSKAFEEMLEAFSKEGSNPHNPIPIQQQILNLLQSIKR